MQQANSGTTDKKKANNSVILSCNFLQLEYLFVADDGCYYD